MDFLAIGYSIVAFIVAIGVLVTIHEFGHFWVARKLGVKVLRFSVGFGKPLWMRKAGPDQTEYVIAAIPLGGYVKMLDEREGEVAAHELERSFNRKSVWRRFAIVAAGPVFNFLFAILAYYLIFLAGVSGVKPVIGEVINPGVAHTAGVRSGDQQLPRGGKRSPHGPRPASRVLLPLPDPLRLGPPARIPGPGRPFDGAQKLDDPVAPSSDSTLGREDGQRRRRIRGQLPVHCPPNRQGLRAVGSGGPPPGRNPCLHPRAG